ncbi:MAG: diacylglycerol kinase family protein [Desulfobulbaceae bacterium]|nr:diacylglycerol kinase family protein [Desulfobulbaceae bacterium]
MGPDEESSVTPGGRGERPFSWKARVESFRYALVGGRTMVRSQHNARIHAVATVLVVIGALVVRVSRLEWALLILAIGLVWAMEALNTAIELLADEISREHRQRLGQAKDVAAFGVLAAAVTAVLIGLLVFIPHCFP